MGHTGQGSHTPLLNQTKEALGASQGAYIDKELNTKKKEKGEKKHTAGVLLLLFCGLFGKNKYLKVAKTSMLVLSFCAE